MNTKIYSNSGDKNVDRRLPFHTPLGKQYQDFQISKRECDATLPDFNSLDVKFRIPVSSHNFFTTVKVKKRTMTHSNDRLKHLEVLNEFT